jgi:O-antigen ligase
MGKIVVVRLLGLVCHGLMAGGLVTAMLFAGGLSLEAMGLPVVLLAAAAICAGLGLALGGRAPEQRWAPAAAVLLATGFFAWRMAGSPVVDFARYDWLLLTGLLAAWAVLRLAPIDWHLSRTLWLVLAVGVLAQVGVASYQFWTDPSFTPIFGKRPVAELGSGFYARYNDLGGFLAAALMPLSALVVWPGVPRWGRVAALLLAAVAVVGCCVTQGRGGLVGLAAGLGVLIVLWLWLPQAAAGKRLAALAVVLPVLIFGGVKLTTEVLVQRKVGENAADMLGYNVRLFYAAMAFEQVLERPWLGSGSQSYSYEHVRFWPSGEYSREPDPQWVHNEYIQTVTDYGLIGLVLVLVVVGWTWVSGVTAETAAAGCAGCAGCAEGAVAQALRAGSLAGMAALGIAALFSFHFHLLPTLLVFGLFSALAVPRRPADHRGLSRWKLVIGLLLIGGLAMPVAAREAHAWWRGRAYWGKGPAEGRRAALEAMLEVRPGFVGYQMLGADYLAAAAAEPDASVRRFAMEQAEAALAAACQRHPSDWATLLNWANVLDSLGRFEQAEALHAKVTEVGDPREALLRGRFYRGRHYDLWARSIWAQRRPEEALWLLHRARDEFIRADELSLLAARPEFAEVAAQNAATIKLLETARVQPVRPGFIQ